MVFRDRPVSRLAWNNVDLDSGSVVARLKQAAIEPDHAVEF